MIALAGVAAGFVFGYVLQRSDLCFHAAWRGLLEHRFALARAWILGVAVASVGLLWVSAETSWDQLTRGLSFEPARNITGGLLIGVGMVVASSCASGLFYKLGSGMLGAAAGLGGWALGEAAVARLEFPGPVLLPEGEEATVPAVLGVPRWTVVLALVAAVSVLLVREGGEGPPTRWAWRVAGLALGLVTTAGWALAGMTGHTFGPTTVGAVAGLLRGRPIWWSVGFLVALVPGAVVAARRSRTWRMRGEQAGRHAELVVGGLLLGAGGMIAGGGNLGHGLSGAAQLNVSSWVVIGSAITGIWAATHVRRFAGDRSTPPPWMAPRTRHR